MNTVYERDLDLNLLRVFAVVAEAGSVTLAASRLYLTQPAVSAALRRFTDFVGADLFARQGRGLVLTSRGAELLAASRSHLGPLVEAVTAPPTFDPKSSTATVRLGLSESTEGWLLPSLLALLRDEAPGLQIVVLPVTFRTIEEALLSRRVDLAISIADELPRSVQRRPLFRSGFVCVFDPRHARLPKGLSEKDYFAHEHVVVSYAGDLRGIVEDAVGKSRKVRVSLPSFSHIGDVVEGSALLATVPLPMAQQLLRHRPWLRSLPLPFRLEGSTMELLWLRTVDDHPLSRFLRSLVERAITPLGVPPAKATRGKRPR
jgi:LysR family transcriptional regulator, mexEF-oprN operon transcriptional activator